MTPAQRKAIRAARSAAQSHGADRREIIRAELQRLSRNGRLTPDRVVQAAAAAASPLHELFEWNDEIAGHRYRLDQARELIASIEVEVIHRETHEFVPTYTRDPRKGAREQGYVETATLRTDRAMATAALRNEVGRAAAYLQRCYSLAVGLGLEAELRSILDDFAVFREALEAEEAAL